jgi:hypothetical protein
MTKWVMLLLMVCGSASALEAGDRLAPWTLLDQFDQPYSLDDNLQILLVARSMKGAELVETALQEKPKGYLQARRAVFLADISRMPAAVAKLFAIPAMRDYNYRVLLDRNARVAPRYPGAQEAVLWLDLREGRLQSQRSFTEAAALGQALEAAGK